MRDWLAVSLITETAYIESMEACLLMADVDGWELEDAADFAAFLSRQERDWDYIRTELLEARQAAPTRIRFYLPATAAGEETRQRLLTLLAEKLPAGAFREKTERVSDADWENKWRQFYKPMRIGEHFVVKPDWEPYAPVPGDIVLELEPGMAFGTGSHQTTRLCLQLLERHFAGGPALDLGCGSGILAIAAALLGAEPVLGVDIDAQAVAVAAENARRNHVAELVNFRQGDLAAGLSGSFTLVVANIVADVILRLAPELPFLLAPGGVFIASGIIAERADELEAALAAVPLTLLERLTDGAWVALAYRA